MLRKRSTPGKVLDLPWTCECWAGKIGLEPRYAFCCCYCDLVTNYAREGVRTSLLLQFKSSQCTCCDPSPRVDPSLDLLISMKGINTFCWSGLKNLMLFLVCMFSGHEISFIQHFLPFPLTFSFPVFLPSFPFHLTYLQKVFSN